LTPATTLVRHRCTRRHGRGRLPPRWRWWRRVGARGMDGRTPLELAAAGRHPGTAAALRQASCGGGPAASTGTSRRGINSSGASSSIAPAAASLARPSAPTVTAGILKAYHSSDSACCLQAGRLPRSWQAGHRVLPALALHHPGRAVHVFCWAAGRGRRLPDCQPLVALCGHLPCDTCGSAPLCNRLPFCPGAHSAASIAAATAGSIWRLSWGHS
jgi:hypothetical protein